MIYCSWGHHGILGQHCRRCCVCRERIVAHSIYSKSSSVVQVEVKTIDASTWEAEFRQKGSFNEHVIVHLKALWEIMREACRNKAQMASLEAAQARLTIILGRKPNTFEEDLANYMKTHAVA